MSKTKFYVNWSIDCEATQHSVNDAELGRNAAKGFADVLDIYGLKGSFFMIPGDAEFDSESFWNSMTHFLRLFKAF